MSHDVFSAKVTTISFHSGQHTPAMYSKYEPTVMSPNMVKHTDNPCIVDTFTFETITMTNSHLSYYSNVVFDNTNVYDPGLRLGRDYFS